MLEKTYHLGSQGNSCIALEKKKKRLIFYNKYHNDCSIFYHCIIHQGAFCSKLSDLYPMLSVLTHQAIFIYTSLFFPQHAFQVFLQEFDVTHEDLFLHDNMRLLSKEGVLKCSSELEHMLKCSCVNNNIYSQSKLNYASSTVMEESPNFMKFMSSYEPGKLGISGLQESMENLARIVFLKSVVV